MIYRVFLAEDETMIRNNIIENSIWNQSSFLLCGSAANGEEALQRIQEIEVDILITDIRMPFMDGLELSARIRKLYPKIQIIILSGYSEFEYAKKAITLGIGEYLMKPVSPKGLLESLEKAAAVIDKERHVENSLNQLNTIIEQNKKLPVRRYLCRIISGFMTEDQILSEARKLGLKIEYPYYIGVIADLSCCNLKDSFYYEIDAGLRAVLTQPDDTYYFPENDNTLCFLFMGQKKEELLPSAQEAAARLNACLNSCSIGIGTVCESPATLWQSFFTARASLTMKETAYVPDSGANHDYFGHIQKELILNLLKFGTINDVPSAVNMIRSQLTASKISNIYFLYFSMETCMTVKNFLYGLSENLPDLFEKYTYGILSPSSGIHEIEHFLTISHRLLTDALIFRDQIQKDKYGDIITRAKSYIMSHFSSPDLNLIQVAESVHMSPSYFSSMFSHETGETFIEYLTNMRIEKAKELLRTSNMRTTDIAFEVGYNSTNHFYKMFKRIVKQSPKDFRNLTH